MTLSLRWFALRCLATLWLAAACTFALASPADSSPPLERPVVALQDGILASLRSGSKVVQLQWRFFHAPPAPITAITADLAGKALRAVAMRGYPLPGDRTDILFLFDLTDRRRADELQRDKVLALLLMSRMQPYQDLGLAFYGARSWLLDPVAGGRKEILNDLLSLAPLDQVPDRDAALLNAILFLGTQHAARRAVYVFSDGYDGAKPRRNAVIGAALHYGVSVNFVTANAGEQRRVDSADLRLIARATGGEFITRANLPAFLHTPFRLLDSGGEVLFSTAGVTAPSGTPVRVRISYGKRVLELDAPASSKAIALSQRLTRWFAQAKDFMVQLPHHVTRWLAQLEKLVPQWRKVSLVVIFLALLVIFRNRLRRSKLALWLEAQMRFEAGGEEKGGARVDEVSVREDRRPILPPRAEAVSRTAPVPAGKWQASTDELWNDMIQRLQRCGGLPKDHTYLTLNELAAMLPRGEDADRFQRLVSDWYYPRKFAQTQGRMRDDEAEQIMTSLFRSRETE